jgi:D-alanyl-D-alanine carboxypeptidase
MRNLIILAAIIASTFSMLIQACKKESDVEPKVIGCNLDYSGHPKNEIYQKVLDKYIEKGLPGLSVLISIPGDSVWAGVSGYANIEDKIKMTPCNFHHYASIAKTYTAVIILQLIEEGKLSFDDKISEYLDKQKYDFIPNFDKININQLLLQTSGLPDVFEVEFLTAFFNDPSVYYSTDDFLEFIRDKKPIAEPGKTFKYSDANYMLLSLIIDKIDGDHIKSFTDRIFTPLNLVNTYYHNNINYPNIDGLVLNYWDEYSNGTIENVTDWQLDLTNMVKASDGIIGNIFDLEIFIKSVFNGDLLAEGTINQMLTNWVDANESDMGEVIDYYGYGLMRIDNEYGTWVGHMGNHIGSASYVFYNVEKDITVEVMTNMGTFFSFKYKGMIFYDLMNDLMDAINE